MSVRAYRENAARARLRNINANKAAKRERQGLASPAPSWAPTDPPPEANERFHKLVAESRGEDYAPPRGDRRRLRWWFVCDCGQRLLLQVANVRYNAAKGWCSCPACYAAHREAT